MWVYRWLQRNSACFSCIINVFLRKKLWLLTLAVWDQSWHVLMGKWGHTWVIWDGDLASLPQLFSAQKPMTSKWALYKPNKVLYVFTDQNLFLWITIIPTNKSPKIISALLWATGHVGHCPCEVNLSCKRFVAHI